MQEPWQALLPAYAASGHYTSRYLRNPGPAVKAWNTTGWGKLSQGDTHLRELRDASDVILRCACTSGTQMRLLMSRGFYRANATLCQPPPHPASRTRPPSG